MQLIRWRLVKLPNPASSNAAAASASVKGMSTSDARPAVFRRPHEADAAAALASAGGRLSVMNELVFVTFQFSEVQPKNYMHSIGSISSETNSKLLLPG